jgi:hypothetical protein
MEEVNRSEFCKFPDVVLSIQQLSNEYNGMLKLVGGAGGKAKETKNRDILSCRSVQNSCGINSIAVQKNSIVLFVCDSLLLSSAKQYTQE